MARYRYHLILALGALLALYIVTTSCLKEGFNYNLQGQDVHLTVLHTSDIHSRLLPYKMSVGQSDQANGMSQANEPFGGIARLVGLLKRERARANRVIHLDSGDYFQGAPIFNVFDGEVEVRMMSEIGLDAAVVGNHEFDKGVQNLHDQLKRWSTYPVLAANYVFEDLNDPLRAGVGDIIKPYTIIQAQGLRVGVIGMGDQGSMTSIIEGGNSLALVPLENRQAAQSWVDFLRPQVDLVAIVSHMGLHEDESLVQPLVREACDEGESTTVCDIDGENCRETISYPVRGVDIIFGGHLHITLNPPKVLTDCDGRRVLLVHSGAFLKYAGRLDVVVHVPNEADLEDLRKIASQGGSCLDLPVDCDGTGKVVSHQYQLFPIDSSLPQDAAILDMLEPYVLEMNKQIDLTRIVGYAAHSVSRFSTKGGDSQLGNLVADAMRRRNRVDAEFGMTNSLGIRTDFAPGPITVEDMYNVFPFENTITAMYLSGREMQELFDYITDRSAGRGCAAQAQIAGARFLMDCGQSMRNEERHPCQSNADCYKDPDAGKFLVDYSESCMDGVCWAHPAKYICLGEQGQDERDQKVRPQDDVPCGSSSFALNPNSSYEVATNDYIAHGGSGFEVLKRNTTKIETGISMRDAAITYIEKMPTCVSLCAQAGLTDPASCPAYTDCVEDIRAIKSAPCKDILDTPANLAIKEDCLADADRSAEQLCLELPCIEPEEDGRIQAVPLPSQAEPVAGDEDDFAG